MSTGSVIDKQAWEERKEAWRRFRAWEAAHQNRLGAPEKLARAGQMVDFFLSLHPAHGKDEESIMETVERVRRMHEILGKLHREP